MQGYRLGFLLHRKYDLFKLWGFRLILQCWCLYSFHKYCRKSSGNICKNTLGFVIVRRAVLHRQPNSPNATDLEKYFTKYYSDSDLF